jgi:hypothetical protein
MATKSDKRKLSIIETVKNYYEEKGKVPSIAVLENMGIPRRTIRRYFGSMTELLETCFESMDSSIFSVKTSKKLVNSVEKKKTFFVTTAIIGAPVDKNALKSAQTFASHNKGDLLVIPVVDPSADVIDGLDPLLKETTIVNQNIQLNSNLNIFTIKLSAKQIKPLTGLARIGNRNTSFIFGSPKQDLEYVPVGNNKIPHAIMSTGAITKPTYGTSKYMSCRTSFIAEQDHFMGGIIVEIVDDKIFHFRTVEFIDGKFTDLGKVYKPDGTVTDLKRVKNLTLGDWHTGKTCPIVRKTTEKMIKDLSPDSVILHDFMEGLSVNHWLEKKPITKANMTIPLIAEEGKMLADELNWFDSLNTKAIHVVKSNHDIWIDRYLEDFKFKDDVKNIGTCCKLILDKLEGKDTLEALVVQQGFKGTKVKFLKRDNELKIGNTEYGVHGDRFHKTISIAELEKSYGRVTVGHRHTAFKKGHVMGVGTSTPPRLSYSEGAISATNTHEVQNLDGSRQLINIIDGKYRR